VQCRGQRTQSPGVFCSDDFGGPQGCDEPGRSVPGIAERSRREHQRAQSGYVIHAVHPTIWGVDVLAPNTGGPATETDEPVRVGEKPPVRTPGATDRERLLSSAMPDDRARSWLITLVVAVIAGVVR